MGTRDLHNNFEDNESEVQNDPNTPLRISVPQAQLEVETEESKN